MKLRIFLIILCATLFVIDVNAATDFTDLVSAAKYPGAHIQDYVNTSYDDAYKIPSEYYFTPKFRADTTVEFFGNSNGTYGVFTIFYTSENTPGEYGVIYRNVGTYNGEIIDVKYIITGIEENTNLGAVKSNIGITASDISFMGHGVISINYKMVFLKHNTNEEIAVKGFISLTDIDANDGVIIDKSTIKDLFISEKTSLVYKEIDANKVLFYSSIFFDADANGIFDNGIGINEKYMITYTFEGSSLEKTFVRNYSDVSRSAIGYQGYTLAPIEQGYVKKQVEVINKDNYEYEYTIDFFVPDSMSSYYYNRLMITDSVSEVFNINSVKVYNNGKDVSDYFDITITNNLVEVRAKSAYLVKSTFYDNQYLVKISVSLNPSKDLSSYLINGTYQIKNMANYIVDNSISNSNIVSAEKDANVTLEIDILTDNNTSEDLVNPSTGVFLPMVIILLCGMFGIGIYRYSKKNRLI